MTIVVLASYLAHGGQLVLWRVSNATLSEMSYCGFCRSIIVDRTLWWLPRCALLSEQYALPLNFSLQMPKRKACHLVPALWSISLWRLSSRNSLNPDAYGARRNQVMQNNIPNVLQCPSRAANRHRIQAFGFNRLQLESKIIQSSILEKRLYHTSAIEGESGGSSVWTITDVVLGRAGRIWRYTDSLIKEWLFYSAYYQSASYQVNGSYGPLLHEILGKDLLAL